MLHLVQHAVGFRWERALRFFVAPWHRAYCLRHGYRYAPGFGALPGQPTPGWCKVLRLREELEAAADGDIVVWLDVDAAITDPSVLLAGALRPNAQIGMVLNRDEEHNAGALWLRAGPDTRNFLRDVALEGPGKAGKYKGRDQDVINRHAKKLRLDTLPKRWNHYPFAKDDGGNGKIVQAWHGFPDRMALQRVARAIRTARRAVESAAREV